MEVKLNKIHLIGCHLNNEKRDRDDGIWAWMNEEQEEQRYQMDRLLEQNRTSQAMRGKALAEAVDAIMMDHELQRVGVLSTADLFIRWQKHGDRIAQALGLPPQAWQPIDEKKSVRGVMEDEKRGA